MTISELAFSRQSKNLKMILPFSNYLMWFHLIWYMLSFHCQLSEGATNYFPKNFLHWNLKGGIFICSWNKRLAYFLKYKYELHPLKSIHFFIVHNFSPKAVRIWFQKSLENTSATYFYLCHGISVICFFMSMNFLTEHVINVLQSNQSWKDQMWAVIIDSRENI